MIAGRESSLSICAMVEGSLLPSAVRITAVDTYSLGIRNAMARPTAIPAAARPPIRQRTHDSPDRCPRSGRILIVERYSERHAARRIDRLDPQVPAPHLLSHV